jgi:hypothetical protein
MILRSDQMMIALLGYMEWWYTITEINKIMLFCLVHAGQAYWLVLMDTQQNMKNMVFIIFQAVKMDFSEQKQLSFTE